MIRIVLASILGGLLMFAWGAVAHLLLPISRDALTPLPDEAPVIAALTTHVPEAGTYAFPWIGHDPEPDEAQRAEWERRLANGPSGLLVYRPYGGDALSPRALVTEFASNLLAAFLGALLLVQLPSGFGRRVLTVMLVGVAAWLSISVSQWNWYGFSRPFVLFELIDQAIGWLLAGIGMALLVRPPRKRTF